MPGVAFSYAMGDVWGAIGIVLLVIALSPSGHHVQREMPLIEIIVFAFVGVPVYCVWHPRRMRRKVEKALRVNSSSEE